MQVVSIVSCHFIAHLWEEAGSIFSILSNEVVEEDNKIFP